MKNSAKYGAKRVKKAGKTPYNAPKISRNRIPINDLGGKIPTPSPLDSPFIRFHANLKQDLTYNEEAARANRPG